MSIARQMQFRRAADRRTKDELFRSRLAFIHEDCNSLPSASLVRSDFYQKTKSASLVYQETRKKETRGILISGSVRGKGRKGGGLRSEIREIEIDRLR